MLPVTTTTLVKEPPAGDLWLHELKFDGYRMLWRIDRGEITFWSRNENEWTAKFLNIGESVKSLPLMTAILDGEIVMVDAQGHSSFQKLQRAMSKSATSAFVYEVFDLIYLQKQLDKLSRKTSPLASVPKDPGLRNTHWTEPKLIAEVQLMEWL